MRRLTEPLSLSEGLHFPPHSAISFMVLVPLSSRSADIRRSVPALFGPFAMSEPDRHPAYRNRNFSSELYSRQQKLNTSIVLQECAATSCDERATPTDGTVG